MVLVLLFIHVIMPAGQKKYRRVRADLDAIALAANLYATEHQCLPNSLQQLDGFVVESSEPEIDRLPQKDPWKRDYFYLKMSDECVAVGSTGRNRRLDTARATLEAVPEDKMYKLSEDGVYRFSAPKDDWIYVVGSMPIDSHEE